MSKIHKGIKLKKIVSKEDQYYLLLDEIGNDLERLRVTKNITQKQLVDSLVAPTFKSLLDTSRNTASDESKAETVHDKKNLLHQRSVNFKLRDKHQKV